MVVVARRIGVERTDSFGGVDSLRLMREVDMRSRVAELLRLLDDRRSSVDFSFRRRGKVANLSPVGDLASRLIEPSLVLMMRCSGVDDPARPFGFGVIGVVGLAEAEGHRPSSTVGVADGVRQDTDGVRVLLERCSDGKGWAPDGRESGLTGRLSGVEREGVVAAVLLNGGSALSRDRALSWGLIGRGGELAASFDWNAARLAEAALDRERATEFSSFFPMDLGPAGSMRATFFRTTDAFRFTGPPVIDELSLPPSLVQS